ncbi:MAG: chitobiase/beta-hexosaminidase C-terminal domain-containing protein, partial [Terracidiphilus sp.]
MPRLIFLTVLCAALNLPVPGAQRATVETSGPSPSSGASPRVIGPVDDAVRVVLHGNLHTGIQNAPGHSEAIHPGAAQTGAAQAVTDLGAVDDSQPADRMLLLLQRSPAQETALGNFIRDAHTPGSSSYHQWLTPSQFGRLYGPADSDVAAVTAWLESHGLTVNKVHAGRVAIEFSGTAGQMRAAFHTRIHSYRIHGQLHLAAASDPSVPAALAPVIAGLAPVDDFHPAPELRVLGQAQFNPKTHQATPEWTYPQTGGVSLAVAPGDFAVQYDINPVYSAGITGTGQSIAIISESNVDLSLVQAYQTLFGLRANLPQVVIDGADPGETSAATEAYLDLEAADAAAPGATVILYTSAGTALSDGLALAAYRAVSDDLAGVISVSYTECEAELGQSGNAFWNALWEQAAAQGQTVFVAAGDGGSAGCDDFDTQQNAYGGLAVNGIASTPYDVAVGGTDFYYSQYAGTSSAVNAQVGTYWSLTSTTAPAVSLTQPVPEQAWNDFFGYNLTDGGNPSNLSSENILASGGGVSSDAVYPSGSGTGQGYPKPAWQTGNGVPADGARDLPDLSLFAANGYNYSFFPICASPGDCSSANLNSGGAETITGVGGTSVSAPSMAGIQALIDQSAGSWQGQADYIYYPLAAQEASAFHDVTVGGNRVLCSAGTSNCVPGSSVSNSGGYTVESGYSAGAGYDQATGLGSVDVAKLLKYWNTVTFTPTSATLSVSPTSLMHGQTVTISGSVVPGSGSGTPSGSVALISNNALPHSTGIDDLVLAAGTFSAQIDNLPGGTYQLMASYGGDGTFSGCQSSPVTVTVTPENDTLSTSGWVWNPYDLNLYLLSAGMSLPYGAQIRLDAQPVSGNATLANEPTPATGTVAFTDQMGTIATTSTQPLDSAGVAEWSTGVFAPGNHTISESYSGDSSYNPSSAASAASFTVLPGTTSLTVKPLVTTVAAGASVAVDVQLTTGYLPLYGTLPTGNVTVTLGTQSETAAWNAYGTTGNATLEAVVTFNNVAAGLLPLTATYAGDSNWVGSSANGGTVVALSGKFTPTVALTASSASPSPSQTFTLTATVSGPSGDPTPTGNMTFLTDSQSFSTSAALSGGTATIAVSSSAVANGTNVFTALYQGNNVYNAATSNPVAVTITQSDFSLTTQNPKLLIAPSGAGTSILALAPINGFTGTVTVAAGNLPPGFTVTPAALSLSLAAPATDTLTISLAASVTAGTYPLTITASGGGHVHTAQILVDVQTPTPPTFSLATGTYNSPQTLTITDAYPRATIYYTTNGTTPTTASTVYTGAITVSTTETLEAIAVASGYAPSPITTATYKFVVAAPAFSLASGTYSTPQTLTITDSTPGAVTYYTTNGTIPTTSSPIYTGPISITAPETVEAADTAPGYQSSPITTATYKFVVAAPAFSLASGTYSTPQTLTITDSTPGAVTYYTTNGTIPTTSSPIYTGPISITAPETVEAADTAPGYQSSPITTATYKFVVAAPAFSLASGTYSTP